MVSEEPETYDRRQLMLDAITTWRESIREHRQAFMYAWAPWLNVGRDASNEADGTNGPPVSDDEQDASDHDSSDNEADDPAQPSAVVLQDKQLHRIWNRIDAMDWTIVMSIWIALFIGAVLITIYVYASVFVTKAGVFYVIQLDAWFRTWLLSAWSLSERGIFWHCVETWATLSLSLPTYLLGAGGSQATLFRAMRSMGSVTPFAGGVAVYSHDAVSTALLNATQRQYLNGYLVSEQCERFSNVIFPEERHGQVNEIYVLALGEIDRPCQEHSYLLDRVSHTDDNRTASGLSNMFDHGCPLLKEPAHLVDAKDNVIAAERSDIERSVARNLWNRVFFQTPSKQLEIALVSYFDLADQCRRGRIASWLTGGTTKEYRLNDVESIRTVALEAASKSKIGLAVTTVAKEKRGLSLTDANEVLATLIDHLLNGMLSTGHLVISSLDRIQSQPARFKPLWHKDPRAFLIENARLDPAVASVTTVLAEDQDFNVAFGSGTKSVRLQRGSTVQLVISEANTDPAVFGGARSRDFDTNRSAAEIAKILAWTGPLSSVLDNSDQATRSCLGYEQSLKIAQKIVNRFEEIDFDDVDVDRNAQESQRIETAQQLPATAFLNNEVALGLWAAMCASVAGFFLLSGDGVVLQWYACWNVAQFAWAISRLLNSDTAAHCIVLTGVAWYMMGLVVVKYRWDNIKVKWNEQKFDPTLLPPTALRFAVVVCWFSTHVIILYVQRKRRLFFANEADWQDDDLCLGLETWLAGRSAPGELRYLLATLLSGDTAAMKVAITFSVPAMALANVSFWYFWYKERDANARYWMRLGFFSSLMGVVNIVWPHMFNFSVEFWPLMRSLADIFLFTPGIIVAAVCVNERVKLGPKPRKQKNPISLKAWRRSAKIVVVIVFALLAVSSGLFYFIVNATYGSDVCISADYKNHDQYCREGSIELGKVDPHTRLVYQLIHNFGNSRRDEPPEVHPPKYRYGSRKLVKLPGDIYVPTWDEDFPHDSTFERLKYAIFDYLRWPGPHPNEDLVDPFPDPTRAAQILNTVTKEDLEPLELIEYGTLSSDADLEHFTFSGLAAHTVERVAPLDSSGITFISNFSWMAGLAVRQGFEKYGATAYFNAGGGLLKIYWDHGPEGNKDVHPGDANWDHAKWVFRCSVLVGVTVRDHLVGIHFMASNFLSTSAVRNLGPDHPIRRMLKPHTFGAASINKAATLTLVSENSFVHRGTALTTEAMKEALSASVNSIMFQTAEEHLESTKMAGVSEKLYPWGHDLLRFTAIVRDFVEAYIHVYYADDDAVAADEELSEFWHDLWRDPTACFATGNLTRDRVVDTLAHFIVFVTGIHNHVGNVADYIKDPRFVSAKIRPVYVVADIQATFQVLNIGLATSKKMPRLLSNFNHVLLKDEHLETTTNIFQEFQQKLLKFKIAVEDANKLRKYPCNAFNPDKMVSSTVDPHTRVVYQLIHGTSRGGKSPAVLPPKYRYGRRKLIKLPCDIYVPSWDEDFPRDSTYERFMYAVLDYLRWPSLHPFYDRHSFFPNPARAAQILNAVTKEDLEPLELVEYPSLSSDTDLGHFTFSGLAAHTVERVAALNSSGIVFKSNFSWMANFAVRVGFEKYGATAYFNATGGLLKIYWDHGPEGHKDVYPNDAHWDHAKWVFRCSVLVGVTVRDHLVGIHFMASNFLSTSAVRNLGHNHSVRRMLKPHTFGAASINKAASLTLVSERSFVQRATALTTESMKEALFASVNSIVYRTADEHLEFTKMAGVSEELYPWGHDLLKFTAIVKRFVEAYINVYYVDDAAVAADKELSEFWHDLWRDPTASFATGNLTRDRVVDTLAHFIVFVTGIHNHVGNVADYIKDPRFVSAKIRPDYVVADIQATFQVLNIGLATAKKMPRLLDDFTHVLLKDKHLEKTTKIFQQFNQNLTKFKIAVEDANRGRKYKCNAFNPNKMVSSVSI